MKVLLVCLGNICRSPLAHGILQHEVERRGLGWDVDSAGTGGYHVGEAPDPRSVAEARRRGIDISTQRARKLTPDDLDAYDHLLVMDASNYQNARRLARTDSEREKVELIMNYADPGRNGQVPDPYWDDDGFAGVYDMLARAVAGFVESEGRRV